jgi:predicted NUDIX family NTP pyrophosphohydrolase
MAKKSAGILLYRLNTAGEPEFFLVHPGGPFWQKKDLHAWSVPKGEFDDPEDALDAAKREFREETGMEISGQFMQLEPVRQKSGKTVHCFAIEGDFDPSLLKSNYFETEWPPHSGKRQSFPEVDMGEWFNEVAAKQKINEYQSGLIDQLINMLKSR